MSNLSARAFPLDPVSLPLGTMWRLCSGTWFSTRLLSFQTNFHCPRRSELMAMADAWQVPRPGAIVDQVIEAVTTFPAMARKFAVRDGKGLKGISADIRERLQSLRR